MNKLLALLLLSSSIIHAGITLDLKLTTRLNSEDDHDDVIQHYCVFDEKNPICRFEDTGILFEVTAVPVGSSEVLTTIKISIREHDKEYVILEPVIKSVWNKEAKIILQEDDAQLTIQITAHK